MYSPKYLLFSSQLYILGELLQKHAAEASRKGVVGRMGSTIPMVPRIRQISPAVSHSAFVIVRGFLLSHARFGEGFVSFMLFLLSAVAGFWCFVCGFGSFLFLKRVCCC